MVLLFDFEDKEDRVILESIKKSLDATFLRTEIVRTEDFQNYYYYINKTKEFFLNREYYFSNREEIKSLIDLDQVFTYLQVENNKGVKKIYLVDNSYTRYVRKFSRDENTTDIKEIYRDLSNLFTVYTKAIVFAETGLSNVIDNHFEMPILNFYIESSLKLTPESETMRRMSEVTQYPGFIRDFIMKFVYDFRKNCKNSLVKSPITVLNKNFQEDLIDRIRDKVLEKFHNVIDMKDFYFREGKNIRYTTY